MIRTLHALLAALPNGMIRVAELVPDVEIAGITTDSRKVKPGWLFVAYKGVASDGHDYMPHAKANGAVVVVGERLGSVRVRNGREAFAWLCAAWHGFPSRALKVVGITGTDGKTSTSMLLHAMLQASGKHAGLISTVNALIGSRSYDTGFHVTTPDADDFQHYLALMRDAPVSHAVLEITSHGLSQHRVDGTRFDVAVITNITRDHLDEHGSRIAYRLAKSRLFDMTAADGGSLVLNADDAFSYRFLIKRMHKRPATQVLTYSLHDQTRDLVATRIAHHSAGMQLTLRTPGGNIEAYTGLAGDFNVSNILAATGAAHALGLPLSAMAEGIARIKGVPGRMERIVAGQPYQALVDFAHTPNALLNCLDTLQRQKAAGGKLIVVFGCAGERDQAKRPRMARIGAAHADIAIFTAEDPRNENLDQILAQMVAGVPMRLMRNVRVVRDRAAALATACGLAGPNDIVVACGKGHEQSMAFGREERPWDDRVQLRAAIENSRA